MNGQRSNSKLVSSFIHHQELVLFCNDFQFMSYDNISLRALMRNCIKAPRVRKRDRTLTEDEGEREKHEKNIWFLSFSSIHDFVLELKRCRRGEKGTRCNCKLREPREMEEKCIFFDDDDDDDQHWGHRTKNFCMNSSCSVLCRKNVNVEVSVST